MARRVRTEGRWQDVYWTESRGQDVYGQKVHVGGKVYGQKVGGKMCTDRKEGT